MKARLTITFLFCYLAFAANAQKMLLANMSVQSIPDLLKKDANVVYRLDETTLEVISPSKYTEKVHQIITILNSDGASHLQQVFWFDKFNKIEEIEVKLYNSMGFEIQKYKKKDFVVQSYYDGISLVTDDKLMRLQPVSQFPCTIDVSYVRNVSSYIDLPDQYLDNHESSIEHFQYIVKVPAELDIRHRTTNISLQPKIEEINKQKIYTWQIESIPVKKVEAGGFQVGNYLPKIEVASNAFEYDGYRGDFKNWSDFGKWCYFLYQEKAPFNEQRLAEIKALVNGLPDVKSKVAALYTYLQKNTRYVSIQLGIGGFKPFTTRMVDEKKYGDCKALTNYMRNLLLAAGIKSYPALINAGYNSGTVDPAFPANKFNHVILCVPQAKDSIWLECTSGNSTSGFLGNFTENKTALLLTESGGVMVNTPRSNFNNNVLITNTSIQLNEAGGALIKSRLYAKGDFFQLLDAIKKLEPSKQNELMVQYLQYKPGETFTKQTVDQAQELNFTAEYMKLFDFSAGTKYFFPFSVYKMNTENLRLEDRSIEYVFQFPYKRIDTTVFYLPGGFSPESLPKNQELGNEYVSYKREMSVHQNSIIVVSMLVLKQHVIPATEYKKLVQLLTQIDKEELSKLILQKTDTSKKTF